LLFLQNANKVVAQLFANNRDLGIIKDSIVDRNTLRFTVWRPGRIITNERLSPDEYIGAGELVMNADGKSFTGTILGSATSGKLIAR
jgi:hypothetical protein